MRWAWRLCLAGVLLGFVACSDATEVWVANPCGVPVKAAVYVDHGTVKQPESRDSMAGREPEGSATVPEHATRKVAEPISEPGDYRYVLLVEGTEEVLRFDEDFLKVNDKTVVLPAGLCPG